MNDKIKVTTDTQEKERITKERDILVDKKNGRAESF